MNGKLRIPFREINVNTLPIARPVAAKSTVVKSPDPPIKNGEIKPHIIFLGNATDKKRLSLSSTAGVSVGRRQKVNNADPDLIQTRKTITGLIESPFLDVNTPTKLKIHVLTTSASDKDQGKGTEKSTETHSNVSISIIDESLVATPISDGTSSEKKKPLCTIDDVLSDSSLSDDFEPRPKKVTKKFSRKQSKDCNATQPAKQLSSASEISEVMKILPEGYNYNIQMEDIPAPSEMSSNKCKNFIALLKVDIFSAERAELWKTEFEKSSFSDYRVMKTFGPLEESQRVIFKKKYRCHHNTLAEKSGSKVPHEKHTKCPAELTITVRNSEMKWHEH
ncbi:Riboflavin biosynthesis protein RibBA [Frankliniella fusca]|uniref:Riboflavin biosynthesis protein RibBA n=1 Tax=Frankliniella fusca TaxID=407009 RepID=A0AAE1LCE7_9NEOP|nr:Riboflavin biosynthesis protein RibBA [Frankliniella fusca]